MILRGNAMWANVIEGNPNPLSEKYQVDIYNMSEEDIQKLNEAGISLKNDEVRGDFVTAKHDRAPQIFDASKRAWGDTMIGNGSKIKVSVNPYDWTHKSKTGRSLGLNQLMVIEHIPYQNVDELEAEPAPLGETESDVEL